MAADADTDFARWSVAFDRRNEAVKKFVRARIFKDPALAALIQDMDDAQQNYDEVSREIGASRPANLTLPAFTNLAR